MMTSLDELKKRLAIVANEKSTDFDEILKLATAISKSDEKNVRFTIDASHISRLGIELVSRQETAVAELIKNSYDADAPTVDLIFKNTAVKGGVLEIIDAGHGMTREQVVSGFMRISTQDKVINPLSEKFKRQKAGRKGIGRFATQRLGRKLIIFTQLEGAAESLKLEIDWDLFEGGKDLYSISSQITSSEKMPTPGTVLRIENLRDSWSDAQIQRSFRHVANLLQPFPLDKKSRRPTDDPGFKIAFFKESKGDLTTIADEEQSVYAHAAGQFTGEISADGMALIRINSPKYKIDEIERPLLVEPKLRPKTGVQREAYPLLTGVKFTAHYFIQDELPSGTRSMVREILNRQGGIRVYRNGFRVLPYGESFDDWLGLQRSSALRELLPPHHNHNFLGFVEIYDVAGDRFEETASREGLLENESFLQLQDFVYRALVSGVIEIARVRKKKVFANDDSKELKEEIPTEKTTKNPRVGAAEVAEKLRAAALVQKSLEGQEDGVTLGAAATENESQHMSATLDAIAEEVEKIGEESQAIFEENGMLRVLASLGLTIGEFTHEVRHTLAALNTILNGFDDDTAKKGNITDAKNHMDLLRSYVRYFDEAVINNAHRKLEVHELRDLVSEFTSVINSTLIRKSIELTSDFVGYDLFTKPMHKSEWSSILLNLFTNSLKAIDRTDRPGRIHIHGGVADNYIFIEFSDNGIGIPKENREKIFDAFFTTSVPPSATSNDTDKMVGTGLGLKIVRDIVDSVNGEIYVMEPRIGYATCMRIEIPRADEKEIGDVRY